MGLIKALAGATGGILADQWKEFFYCESIPADVLVMKGQKSAGRRSSNTKGTDNIITTGSVIAVADGQCMMIVDQGEIVEFTAEPGEFTYDASTEPTIFCGNLGEGIKQSFKALGKRFTFGGEPPKDQRIYYFNTKELMGNKYGTPSPVPFRVVDQNIGLDTDISIRCFGEFSYRICDPMLFYKNVCGNVTQNYTRDNLDGQMKTELLTALGPAFAKISAKGIRYSALPGHTFEIAEALNEVLTPKWRNLRGIEIVSFGVSNVNASPEDEAMIKELQKTAVFRNANMAGAYMVGAQGEAMKAAASNPNGAMMGFMGMGMAQQAGGMNAAQLFQIGQQQTAQQQAQQLVDAQAKAMTPASSAPSAAARSRNPSPQTAGSAPAVLPPPENSVRNAAARSRRTTAGSAAAAQPSPVNSAPNAAVPSLRTTAAGPAPAAPETLVSSVRTVAARSLPVFPSTAATSAAGSLPIPPRRPGSVPSAAIPLTTATLYENLHPRAVDFCEQFDSK